MRQHFLLMVVILILIVGGLPAAGFSAPQAASPLLPASPATTLELLAQLTSVPGSDLAVSGNYAYLNLGGRLATVNIANPANPTLIGQTPALAGFEDIALAGDLALVATGATLQIVDVTNRAAPVLRGAYAAADGVRAVAVAGSDAYLVGSNGLKVVQFSDPSNPQLVGSYATTHPAVGVAVASNRVYLVTSGIYSDPGAFLILNVTNPAAPALLGSVTKSDLSGGVAVLGARVYLTESASYGEWVSRVSAWNVSDPAAPTLLGSFTDPDCSVIYWGIAAQGDYVFVAGSVPGLRIINAADPAHMALAATYDNLGSADGIAVVGSRAYVGDRILGGLRVLDVGSPASPFSLGTYGADGVNLSDVAQAGAKVYTAVGTGLMIYDVANPSAPHVTGYLHINGGAFRVALSASRAYVLGAYTEGDCRDSRFGPQAAIVDVSNPAAPALLATVTIGPPFLTSTSGVNLAVGNNLLLITDGEYGLFTFDVSNPQHPVALEDLITEPAYAIALEGNRAYLGDRDLDTGVSTSYLRIYDTTNPAHLVHLSSTTLNSPLDRVAVRNARVFVSAGSLLIYDATNPASPVLQGAYPGDASALAPITNRLYRSRGSSGVDLLDVSNPASPALLAAYNTAGSSAGLAADGNLLYVADGGGGLLILRANDGATPTPTLTPTNAPFFAGQQEAENGILSGSMAAGRDEIASACYFVADSHAYSGSRVTFALNVPYTANYFLWARVKADDWTHNSFFVIMDAGPAFHYEIQDGSWAWHWDAVHVVDQAPYIFSLAAGNHTLAFETREANARLDAIYLVNRGDVTPYAITPCGATSTPTPTLTRTPTRTPTRTRTPTPTATATMRAQVYLPVVHR